MKLSQLDTKTKNYIMRNCPTCRFCIDEDLTSKMVLARMLGQEYEEEVPRCQYAPKGNNYGCILDLPLYNTLVLGIGYNGKEGDCPKYQKKEVNHARTE